MDSYRFLNIPDSCFIGGKIYKKLFYDNADVFSRDKAFFTSTINKITWVYCLKPETINIPHYKDQMRDYPEVEIIEVDIKRDYKLKKIAEIIMRAIPYPMLLIFKYEDELRFYAAHQKLSQTDSSKNTIEEFISTDWLDSKSTLFTQLDIRKMRFTNFFALYSDIVDTLSIYNVADIISVKAPLTGPEARKLAKDIEDIEQQIISLRAKLKRETQFNRKMQLNIMIKKLEQSKSDLLRGDIK